jgi:hypothetical protein
LNPVFPNYYQTIILPVLNFRFTGCLCFSDLTGNCHKNYFRVRLMRKPGQLISFASPSILKKVIFRFTSSVLLVRDSAMDASCSAAMDSCCTA